MYSCGAIFVRDCPLEGSDVISGIGDAVQFNPLIYEPRQATAGGLCFFWVSGRNLGGVAQFVWSTLH